MQARFMIDDLGSTNFTMTITMTADEWEKLRQQLTREWPSSRLSLAIGNLVQQANARLYVEKDAFN